MDGEPKALTCECGNDMGHIARGHAWETASLPGREFCSAQCVRWAISLDAANARADAADKRAEAIRAKLVEICEDASEGDMEWLSLLKEKSERVSRLEAEAGALRAAVEYVASALRLVIASKPCTFVTEALAASNSALAPGAGERVAEVLKAAREFIIKWDADSNYPGEAADGIAALRAALDALDGGMR